MRVITNSKCLADELHLKYSDQQVQKTECAKSVKKLGSVCRNIGYSQECFPWGGGDVQECGERTEDETSERGTHIDAAGRRYRFQQSPCGPVA